MCVCVSEHRRDSLFLLRISPVARARSFVAPHRGSLLAGELWLCVISDAYRNALFMPVYRALCPRRINDCFVCILHWQRCLHDQHRSPPFICTARCNVAIACVTAVCAARAHITSKRAWPGLARDSAFVVRDAKLIDVSFGCDPPFGCPCAISSLSSSSSAFFFLVALSAAPKHVRIRIFS